MPKSQKSKNTSNKPNIILFTGAGASAPLKLPTMNTVIDKLKDRTALSGTQGLLENIINALKTIKEKTDKKRNPWERIASSEDLEEIYVALLNMEVSQEIFHEIIKHTENYQDIGRYLNDLEQSRANLIIDCKNIVINNWGRLINGQVDKAIDLYTPLLDELFKRCGNKLNVYTTNYDSSVRDICTRLNIEIKDGSVSTRNAQYPSFSMDSFKCEKKPKNKTVCLFHLHGAYNWERDATDDTIIHFAPNARHNEDLNAIIYPSKDKAPIEEPFFSLYDHFGRQLDNADYLIVIGYSFRDFGIVSRIRSASKNNKKLNIIIIDHDLDGHINDILKCNNIIRINNKFEIPEGKRPHYLDVLIDYLDNKNSVIVNTNAIGSFYFEPFHRTPKEQTINEKLIVYPDTKPDANNHKGGLLFIAKRFSSVELFRSKFVYIADEPALNQFGLAWQDANENNHAFHIDFTGKLSGLYNVSINNTSNGTNDGLLYQQLKITTITNNPIPISQDNCEMILRFIDNSVSLAISNSDGVEVPIFEYNKQSANNIRKVGFWVLTKPNTFYDFHVDGIPES